MQRVIYSIYHMTDTAWRELLSTVAGCAPGYMYRPVLHRDLDILARSSEDYIQLDDGVGLGSLYSVDVDLLRLGQPEEHIEIYYY